MCTVQIRLPHSGAAVSCAELFQNRYKYDTHTQQILASRRKQIPGTFFFVEKDDRLLIGHTYVVVII